LCLASLKKWIPEWLIGQKNIFQQISQSMILMFETSCTSH